MKALKNSFLASSRHTPQSTRVQVILAMFLFCLYPFTLKSQTTSFNFSRIPLTDPEINSSGRGALLWNAVPWDNVAAPQVPLGNSSSLNGYLRFNWYQMEQAQGVYSFTGPYPSVEFWLRYHIDRGQSFGFGIMTVCEGCDVPLDGGRAAYPAYLHNLMQAEDVNSRDWKTSGGMWVPNWNSPNYLARFEALMSAMAQFIDNGSYVAQSGPHQGKLIKYRDIIDYVDVRGFGNFGEWHNYPYHNEQPTGRSATSATLKRLIDIHKITFPYNPLILVNGIFEDGPASYVPLDVAHYALTTSNSFGKLGWRRDNLGERGEDNRLALNTSVYNGYRFDTAIVNRWKYAMVTGEPINGGGQYANGGPAYFDLRREINLYHLAHFGNGNYPYSDIANASVRDTLREAFKLTGYRYYLNGGSVNSVITPGQQFNVSLRWQNGGLAPIYEKHWKVVYELRNAMNATVWSGTSYFNPYLFLPGDSTVTDQFTLPSTIPSGTYSLRMVIKDLTAYRPPLQLAVYGRANDGSYLLSNALTVGTAAPNKPPVADAGPDQRLLLPQATAELRGSGTDPENGRLTFQWTLLSGPSIPIIRFPAQSVTPVENLKAGSYFFEIKVTDSAGAFDRDTVMVFVNERPTVSAGSDQTITLPDNIVTLNATASDKDGSIVSLFWQQVAGPIAANILTPNNISSTVQGLVEGEYLFSITVTDNEAATAADTVYVKVLRKPNILPKADAGMDQLIILPVNSLQLDAGNSSDSDGSLVKFSWSVIEGPGQYAFGSPLAATSSFFGFVQGVYMIRLSVTDNEGGTASDTVKITVQPDPNNIAPNANAGTDMQITLPQDSIYLDASNSNDPDGQISHYRWTLSQGPDNYRFRFPDSSRTIVDGLVFGKYVFLLTVTDNQGSTSIDSVIVQVLPDPSNKQPVAAAGFSQVITLPVNSTLLTNAGSYDPDGLIIRSEWFQISGPNTAIYGVVRSDTVKVSQLENGRYRFLLLVTDNSGATDTDTVDVIVNIPPTAMAGADRIIHFPENSVELAASGSYDQDGAIRSYRWSWLSGPTSYQMNGDASVAVTIGNMIVGVYRFIVTITDDLGAEGKDTVLVTVNAKPVANAGPDIILTLPENITVLDGNGSTDADGSIQSYSWNYISGPSSYRLINQSNPATILSELTQGVYVFSLQVTDQYGITSSDSVKVTVNKAPNKIPVANAGSDFSVYLPDPYILLNGSGSYDLDGSIVSYRWKWLAGPGPVNLNDTTSAFVVVSGVVSGTYTFQLTVKDNDGATATTQVNVRVYPPINKVPVARAGRDTTIVLPYSKVQLNGAASFDPDGTIQSYAWRKLTGPSGPVMENTTNSVARVIDLVEGSYSFELAVRDNSGATARDTVRVFVVNTMRADDFFQVAPNPATDQIRVQYQMDAISSGRISVYDQSGVIRQSYDFRSNPGLFQRSIPISSLQPGMYYLELFIQNQRRLIKKFIKQ